MLCRLVRAAGWGGEREGHCPWQPAHSQLHKPTALMSACLQPLPFAWQAGCMCLSTTGASHRSTLNGECGSRGAPAACPSGLGTAGVATRLPCDHAGETPLTRSPNSRPARTADLWVPPLPCPARFTTADSSARNVMSDLFMMNDALLQGGCAAQPLECHVRSQLRQSAGGYHMS